MLPTRLESFFVQEFCRAAKLPLALIDKLRVRERKRSSIGFVTEFEAASVIDALRWDERVFDIPRIAIVGPESLACGTLLFFNRESGKLDAVEGFVYGERWPDSEEPFYWSETERSITGTFEE